MTLQFEKKEEEEEEEEEEKKKKKKKTKKKKIEMTKSKYTQRKYIAAHGKYLLLFLHNMKLCCGCRS